MKLPKSHIGAFAVITWLDPYVGPSRAQDGLPLRGRDALARQVEYGKIDDITDDIVRICHTETTHPNAQKPGEWVHTWVHTELIIDVTIYSKTETKAAEE